jgi:hypothetical protein
MKRIKCPVANELCTEEEWKADHGKNKELKYCFKLICGACTLSEERYCINRKFLAYFEPACDNCTERFKCLTTY